MKMKQTYLKNVVTLRMDEEKCVGCGICQEVCPHQVFKIKAGKANIQNKDACMECGACARNCPAEAITVRAGVGCAAAIVLGKIRGATPTCGNSDETNQCCG